VPPEGTTTTGVLRIGEGDSGRCEHSSEVDPLRVGAYACTDSKGHAHDPCFRWRGSRINYLCYEVPWEAKGEPPTPFVIAVPSQVPPLLEFDLPGSPDSFGRPWAMELASGERCRRVVRSSEAPAGGTYSCSDRGWLFGFPDRGPRRWTVDFAPSQGTDTTPVEVARAWI
jgi:hypothetical protein